MRMHMHMHHNNILAVGTYHVVIHVLTSCIISFQELEKTKAVVHKRKLDVVSISGYKNGDFYDPSPLHVLNWLILCFS